MLVLFALVATQENLLKNWQEKIWIFYLTNEYLVSEVKSTMRSADLTTVRVRARAFLRTQLREDTCAPVPGALEHINSIKIPFITYVCIFFLDNMCVYVKRIQV